MEQQIANKAFGMDSDLKNNLCVQWGVFFEPIHHWLLEKDGFQIHHPNTYTYEHHIYSPDGLVVEGEDDDARFMILETKCPEKRSISKNTIDYFFKGYFHQPNYGAMVANLYTGEDIVKWIFFSACKFEIINSHGFVIEVSNHKI